MSFEQKDLTGALFTNEDRKSEKHPTHTGSCTIDGKQFFVDAWFNEARSGKRYFSLKFKAKMAREHATGGKALPPAQDEFNDDVSDIPF